MRALSFLVLVVFLFVWSTYYFEKTRQRIGGNIRTSSPDRTQLDDNTIFVNIASYRDVECSRTLQDMFQKAKNPNRVFVGVLQQHNREDGPCSVEGALFSRNVRVRHLSPVDAKGPTYARYLAHTLYRNERYYFLLDSHNRFVTNWDELIVQMYSTLPERSVLSHYPEAYFEGDTVSRDNRPTTAIMCNADFIEPENYLRFNSGIMKKSPTPRIERFAAAGMLFAEASLFREVPFDPHLPFLFQGEEIMFSARMWTHGWNIFSPSENIAYHMYMRAQAPKVFTSDLESGIEWTRSQRESVQRVQYVLGSTDKMTQMRIVPLDTKLDYVLVELEKYGLGSKRSLKDYWRFAGVDPVGRTVNNWCLFYTDKES